MVEPLSKWHGYADQHRELVLLSLETPPRDEPATLRDEPLVVRRDPHVATGIEQRLEPSHEARAHLLVALVGELRRLDVDALADPDARAEVGDRADVVERPS